MIADLCSTNKQESQFMSKKQTNKQFLQQDQIIIKYWRYIKENCVDEELAKAGSYILWKWSSFRRLVGKWTVLNYPSDHRYNLKPRLMNSPRDSVFKFSLQGKFSRKNGPSGRGLDGDGLSVSCTLLSMLRWRWKGPSIDFLSKMCICVNIHWLATIIF